MAHPADTISNWETTLGQHEVTTARLDRAPHLDGHPVGRSTYVNHGCRCPDCTTDNSRKNRTYRLRTGRTRPDPKRHPLVAKVRHRERAARTSLARLRAHTELANRHPDEYRQLLEAAKRDVALERGPLPGDA